MRWAGLADLVGDDADQVQGVGPVGVGVEDGAVVGLGLGEPAGLVARGPLGEEAGHVDAGGDRLRRRRPIEVRPDGVGPVGGAPTRGRATTARMLPCRRAPLRFMSAPRPPRRPASTTLARVV